MIIINCWIDHTVNINRATWSAYGIIIDLKVKRIAAVPGAGGRFELGNKFIHPVCVLKEIGVVNVAIYTCCKINGLTINHGPGIKNRGILRVRLRIFFFVTACNYQQNYKNMQEMSFHFLNK